VRVSNRTNEIPWLFPRGLVLTVSAEVADQAVGDEGLSPAFRDSERSVAPAVYQRTWCGMTASAAKTVDREREVMAELLLFSIVTKGRRFVLNEARRPGGNLMLVEW